MTDVQLSFVRYSMIEPALKLLPTTYQTDEHRILLLTIGLFRTGFLHRSLTLKGNAYTKAPERGFWGLNQLLADKALAREPEALKSYCEAHDHSTSQISYQFELNDTLAALSAAALLGPSTEASGFDLYEENWMDAHPDPTGFRDKRWTACYYQASKEIRWSSL